MNKTINEISGVFTTRTPLSHISESISTGTLLNERKIIQPSGLPVDVFCYNGNAFRGQIRDAIAYSLIENLNLGCESLDKDTFTFLFSGGKIGGQSKFDVENLKKHRRLLPVLSILGGCLDNSMVRGKTSVFDMLPICQEAMPELPAEIHKSAVECTYRNMTIEREFSRFDDSKNVNLSHLIKNHGDDVSAMRMGGELLNSGVDLYHKAILRRVSNIELGCYFSGLSSVASDPMIGGQHNKGHGEVDFNLNFNGDFLISCVSRKVKTSSFFDECLESYEKFIAENATDIKVVLNCAP